MEKLTINRYFKIKYKNVNFIQTKVYDTNVMIRYMENTYYGF